MSSNSAPPHGRFVFQSYAAPSIAARAQFSDALLVLVLYKVHRLQCDLAPPGGTVRHPAVDAAILGVLAAVYGRHAAPDAPRVSLTIGLLAYILWKLQSLQESVRGKES